MKTSISLLALLIATIFNLSASLNAQNKEISLDAIHKEYAFYPKSVRGINSMNDGKHYTVNAKGTAIAKYRYKDGEKVADIFRASDHTAIQQFSGYSFSNDEQYILLTTDEESIYRHSFKANFFIYNLETKELKPVSTGGKQQLATLSPDNRYVAFVRDNNIFMVELATMKEVQITSDGKKNEIINGAPDWVYEEEFGFADGFKWSPDGQRIAFYRTDESAVPEYFMSIYGALYPEANTFKYPKAGEANSQVQIKVFEVETGKITSMDISTGSEFYVPRIKWTNDPSVLSVIRLNRLQNEVTVLHCNARTGEADEVYFEKNEKYISEATDDMITYLDDGEHFVLNSEKDGYFHFYNYNFKTGEIAPITSGPFDISSLLGIDQKRKVLYYTSFEESSTEIHLYSIQLNGKGKKRLSEKPGSYSANFSSTYDYYIESFSSANHPPVYTLYNRKGKVTRILEDNAALQQRTEEYGFSPVEFMQVPTESGQILNGYMIKPADFDPQKSYPLFIYVYGGPESQNVVDRWNRRGAWFQMLAQQGYIVACVDNRGTNGRGEAFRKATYMELGKYETIDQVEAATYLGDLDYIDKERIGIFGWSYGGYMTSLCLTKGGGLFKMGIAVAPVTNWRYYDTIYTERFMRTPQENGSGYDDNSPIFFANQLQGKLLLVHGSADDNVHFQNSMDFVTALVEANKQFDMQFYPNKNHGIYGGNTSYHLYTRMTEFILENL